ncbi:acyltransferase family protein [Solimicrobium silvestre]|uniref:acyltransferase family protein n=1 Tax=Solimicrobium silvestre TaxID=2099400 RepID=UPI001FAEAD99|nr:acyltransferase [Solimicrobium silvestre]
MLPTKSAPISRNARVDFLRGVAISCVLILHFALAFGFKNSPLGTLLSPALLHAIAFNGNFGVTMFFVISGFLITSNSLSRWNNLKEINARTFYLFRFARIMPSLLLVLAIIVTLGCLDIPFFDNSDNNHHLPSSYFLISIGSVLSFWHNVLMQTSGYINYCIDVYWSLSVEEVFYLALPLVCLLLRRTWLIVAVCITAIVIGPIYRSQHTNNEIFFMYGYFACFDAIAFGCITALLARRGIIPIKFNRVLRLAAAIALGVVYLRGIDGHEIFGFSLIALASAAFLLGAANDNSPGWSTGRLSSGVRWVGRYSYEIYLFHIVVLGLMRNVLTKEQLSYSARLPWFLLFLVLTALVAWLVARYVSEPANTAIRRRYGH